MLPETHFFEQQDGSRIAYKILDSCKSEEMKNDVPLVLIVGIRSTKEFFMGVEEKLAKNQKVILFDNRGIGESSVVSSADPISVDLMAQDTIALIKHLGIKRFNLLGWSMGGLIALCIALNVPLGLKLEKLVICSSFARRINNTILEVLYNLPKLDPPESIQMQKNEIMKTFEKSYTDYLLERPDEHDKLANVLFNANSPFEIYKRQWEAVKQVDLVSKLQAIKVPTLIFHGEVDTIVPIQEGELLAREISNSKFIRVPEVGHMLPIMEGFEFSAIINDFLL